MRRLILTVLLILTVGVLMGAMRSVSHLVYFTVGEAAALGKLGSIVKVNKFGTNLDIDAGAEESIWDADDLSSAGAGPARCFANMATAAPLCISSDNVADASLGVTVEVLDEDWNVSTIAATLGVAAVTSGTVGINRLGSVDLLRVNRAFATSTALTGNVYIHKDCTTDTGDNGVPDTVATDIVAVITAGANQTLQACKTIPLGFTGLLAKFTIANVTNQGAITFRLRKSVAGAASRVQEQHPLGGNIFAEISHEEIPITFAEKTDIELTAEGAAGVSNSDVTGTFDILLVPNTL